MPLITFPDGRTQSFPGPITGRQLATGISTKLAEVALAIEANSQLLDLDQPLPSDATVRILTARDDDPAALRLLRHSCAHVLAEAVCRLLPGTRLAYGPALDDSFYYDMATPRPVTTDDFAAILAEMKRIVEADRPFLRLDLPPAEGLARVAGDKFKTDNAERALAKGAIRLSFYATGQGGFEDLCAGPHVPSTRFLAHHHLLAVAGAYWHGDAKSDQLTRIYGTCFATAKGLKAHLARLEEAKRRDHRRIGRELELFHLEEENPGQIYWHHRGWQLWRTVESYIRSKIQAAGYIEVKTPALQPQSLWERSGHWAKYRQNMFITFEQDRGPGGEGCGCAAPHAETEQRCFALKPMNCPGHILIFKQGVKSYRDLPLRMSEFGSCVRYEPSGALHGIMRVRGFVQDDAHIFCSEEQIGPEVGAFCTLLKEVYTDFGFDTAQVSVKFSTRPPQRVGSDADWDRAEAALAEASRAAGLTLIHNPGEGAFYGPKLEFVLRDCLGREWQCGTIQVDFQLTSAERLDATYIAADGSRRHPVILHRAVCGSLERFIGILIEHYAGKFPLWLAPEQIRLLPITDDQLAYARQAAERLTQAGLRAQVAEDSEKLGAKIRDARNARVPYYAVVGAEELTAGTLMLHRQDGFQVGALPVAEVLTRLQAEAAARSGPAA